MDNNPVKYTDPSGHDVDCGINDSYCPRDIDKHNTCVLDGGDNGGDRYCALNGGGYIDERHWRTIDKAELLWRKILKAAETGKSTRFELDQTWLGKPGQKFEKTIVINGALLAGMTEKQLKSVGAGVWLQFQQEFEAWQGYSSNFDADDIPSTYLAYVDAVSPDKDFRSIVNDMGGGTTASQTKSPDVQNKTQFFITGTEDDWKYRSYPSILSITPVQNNNYWTIK